MTAFPAVGRAELEALMAQWGQPRYRAGQVLEQLWKSRRFDFGGMSTLPASLREKLAAELGGLPAAVSRRCEAADGTVKLLLELRDGANIEMVVIPFEDRTAFCLSTQVGCPVGCFFCASGAAGLERNLDASEMLAELCLGAAEIGRWPDNVVFMGIGEGLLNCANLFAVLEFMTGKDYIGMSPRRITVSTSGVKGGIRKLAELGREYNLAVSLHAPDDATRAKIIPPALRRPVDEIMADVDFYREHAGRMVTLEYTLLDGVNDSFRCADDLAQLARKHCCKVNLIGYNPTGSGFKRPPRAKIKAFLDRLLAAKAHATLRLERGLDRDAACGQLRLSARKSAQKSPDGLEK